MYNKALKNCHDLMNQDQHIYFAFQKQSDELKKEYQIKLLTSIDCIRFLLCQGLAFCGRDESLDSSNRRNFLELLSFLANHNDVTNEVVVGRMQKNLKLTSLVIQKDIVNVIACEIRNSIIKDLGDDYFAILVDESRDVSGKEQMVVVLRYVDKRGFIIERLLGIVHVTETTVLSLKSALENLLFKHDLSLSRIRGQGYDGASNMRGKFNGLKSLIMKENQAAHYIYSQAIDSGEIQSRRELNQETNLKRASDIRCGSHYASLLNLLDIEKIVLEKRAESRVLMDYLYYFEFAFSLYLMKAILRITNDLSVLLQRKDQDILNAMKQVRVSKTRLQNMRDEGRDSLLCEVSTFCNVNSKLLTCIACLSPNDSFSSFNKDSLMEFATFYPSKFSNVEPVTLDNQLENYIVDMQSDEEFLEVKGIDNLARKLVETKRNVVYPLVYLLLKLALILLMATTTVERVFSNMKYIKNQLKNQIGNDWLNNCMLTFIEKGCI
ncbi:hypothetical protein CDL12_18585 [Handroanthus impetiginosus]|uniref:Zinc finger MYM-type protein 1-like n=1 Tax=Handroanthus impetiginosus TaxID=429701 RepID=A0A2G9GU99_9LAMI|nr:hypothetical protein CDL12_18585 [Handroanthus impetiginosus]